MGTVAEMPPPSPFCVGQSVILKSGGPIMTVVKATRSFVTTQWFDKDGELLEHDFDCNVLEIVKPSSTES